MSGCDGCLTSAAGQQQALNNIRIEAKKYAVEHEKTIAIYKEGYEWRFCEFEIAIRFGYAITEVLSKHN